MVRFKNRYLLCKLLFENNEILDSLSPYAILSAIKSSVEQLYGDSGLALMATLQTKYFCARSGLLIIRVPHAAVKQLWSAVFFTTRIKNRKVQLKVFRVSGTIRQAQIHAIEYNRLQLRVLKMAKLKCERIIEEQSNIITALGD